MPMYLDNRFTRCSNVCIFNPATAGREACPKHSRCRWRRACSVETMNSSVLPFPFSRRLRITSSIGREVFPLVRTVCIGQKFKNLFEKSEIALEKGYFGVKVLKIR